MFKFCVCCLFCGAASRAVASLVAPRVSLRDAWAETRPVGGTPRAVSMHCGGPIRGDLMLGWGQSVWQARRHCEGFARLVRDSAPLFKLRAAAPTLRCTRYVWQG